MIAALGKSDAVPRSHQCLSALTLVFILDAKVGVRFVLGHLRGNEQGSPMLSVNSLFSLNVMNKKYSLSSIKMKFWIKKKKVKSITDCQNCEQTFKHQLIFKITF